MAEWLGKGLQNPVRRFNSASDLKCILGEWWNGIHSTLKMLRSLLHEGSSPSSPTVNLVSKKSPMRRFNFSLLAQFFLLFSESV